MKKNNKKKASSKKLPSPRDWFTVGDRVELIHGSVPGTVRWAQANNKYSVLFDGGVNESVHGKDMRKLLAPKDRTIEKAKGAINNRDLQISVLKDQLHEASVVEARLEKELDNLKAALDSAVRNEADVRRESDELIHELRADLLRANQSLRSMGADDMRGRCERLEKIVRAFIDGRL